MKLNTVAIIRCPVCAEEIEQIDVSPETELIVTYSYQGVRKSEIEVNLNLYKRFPHDCKKAEPTDEG